MDEGADLALLVRFSPVFQCRYVRKRAVGRSSGQVLVFGRYLRLPDPGLHCSRALPLWGRCAGKGLAVNWVLGS